VLELLPGGQPQQLPFRHLNISISRVEGSSPREQLDSFGSSMVEHPKILLFAATLAWFLAFEGVISLEHGFVLL
jgi:hypothetical protein